MSGLKLAFMGSPDLGLPCLEALAAAPDMDLRAVVTLGDRHRGRRGKITPTPVGQAALDLGLPLLRWEKGARREIEDALRPLALDAIVVLAFARLLPPSLLNLPRLGCLNLHASLLPWGRGASPIQQAILEGLAETGWSAMLMEEGLDCGPVLATRSLRLAPDWNSGDLYAALKDCAPDFLLSSLRGWAAGKMSPEAQDDHLASYAGKIPKKAGAIDWALPAAELRRRILAYTPAPGAWCRQGDLRLRVQAADALLDISGEPGEILSADSELIVACGLGALRLLRVQPAGRRSMSARDWLNGVDLPVGRHLENG